MPEKIRINAQRDAVNHPKHYELPGLDGVEAIDVIKSALGPGGYVSFCQGNALKYLIRAGKKNGSSMLEDFRKAQKYCGWAAETQEEIWEMYKGVIGDTDEEVEDFE